MGQAPQHQPYTTHSSPQIQSFSPVHPAYPGPASTTQTSMITNQQQVRDGSAPPLLQPPSTYLVSPSSARASPGAALPQTGTMSPGLSMPAPSAPAYYTAADGNGNQVPHGGGPLGDSRTGPPAAPVAQSHSTMYTTATMLPISNPPANAPMGPPAKPAERPTKEYEYDVSDTLAGTGIDIRQEEQALTDYYASSFAPEARTGFAALPPGGRHSFYGAGIANQAAQATPAESQEQLAAQAAEDIWNQAAQRLANIRKNELEHPFLALNAMHKKLEKITKDHGLGLQLDMKNPHLWAGKMQRPVDFPQPKVVATMNMTPDGMILKTGGSWIPHDAFLCDQLALLSLATRHRLREKLEDADMAASNRQHTSHGEIPLAWADVGTSPNLTGPALSLSSSRDATDRAPNPRKRSFEAFNAPVNVHKEKNVLAQAVRDGGKADRAVEEARLQRRQKRQNPESAQASVRGSSAVPGTPGTVAPDLEPKTSAKKETKKGMTAARMADVSNTSTANATINQLMGSFGRGKKSKRYNWMTAGAGGGSQAPKAGASQELGNPNTSMQRAGDANSLTMDGKYRLGAFREDGEKGRYIQIRDWVTALELEGLDTKAMQLAYAKLDESAER